MDAKEKVLATNGKRLDNIVPTLMLFRCGEVLWRTSGIMQKSELLAAIDPFQK